ncbi:HD domain-containing protein [Actinokineospora sp. NPDC004072]
MYDELGLPDTELARGAWEFVRATHPEYLFNHAVRTFVYAREIGRGAQVDLEVLFLGCVLHDVGLTLSTGQRFEVDGADEARRFLRERGVDEAVAEVVWQAIALHTSVGIAGRMRPEVALVQAGSGADVLGVNGIPPQLRADTERVLPWLDLSTAITEAVVARARADARTAPPLSFPAQVYAEWTGAAVPGWRELIAMDKRGQLV